MDISPTYWLNLGVKAEDDFLERRKVQVGNFIVLFLIVLNLANTFIFSLYYFHPVLLSDSLASVILGIVFYFFHIKGFRNSVRHSVIIISIFSVLNLGSRYGGDLGFHFYLVFAAIVSFLLFDNALVIGFYSIFSIAGFLVLEFYFLNNPLYPDPNLAFGKLPNEIISFGMMALIIFIFKKEAVDYKRIVESQNADLTNLTVKLMFQKDEAVIVSNQLKRKSRLLEQQNQSIVDSLRLASLLQQESLPLEETLFHGLKSGFMFFKAMQMVSGDFYWGKSTMQGQLLVVADCIGHGVPGGMMAIFSANLISQIVEDHGKTFPSDILAELDARLRRRIKQDTTSEIGDGMDISVVLISEGRVSFSAASRPILRFYENGKSQLIAGTRFQLASGKHKSGDFETIEIETQPGDRFYMFTDGITDQFSELTGKKLGTKRLVDEISQLQHLPMKKQKAEIEALLLNWQGKESQTDDMLLIAFEV